MVICSLDALKKCSKKKEARIKKEKIKKEIGMTKFLALTWDLLGRITLTLISYFTITGCIQKVIFKGFNLSILNFEFCILVCVMRVIRKIGCFMWK